MVSLKSQSNKQRFWRGWIAGFVFFLCILLWLLTLWDWAGLFIVFGYVALCAALGATWGAWALACGALLKKKPLLLLVAGPSLWVLLEFLRSSTQLGFAWGVLGYALTPQLTLAQLAAWTGVWGLSFLVVLVNVGLFLAWQTRNIRYVLWVGLLLIGIGLWGAWHRQGVDLAAAKATSVTVALVQPNISQRKKSDPSLLDSLRDRYQALLTNIDASVDLVILPESILPTLILNDSATFDMLTNVAKNNDAAVLFGAFTAQQNKLFNSTLLLDPEGAIKGQYDKIQLVPFSTEYFPLIDELKALGLADWLAGLPLGALSRGSGFQPLEWGKFKIGTPICFESSFGWIGRNLVNNGANVLVIVTNDAWFKRSIELEQHFSMATLRAIETGRSVVQVANTGTSGVILPTGKRLLRLPEHQALVDTAKIPLLETKTFYLLWGDWFAALMLVNLLVCSIYLRFNRQEHT